MKCETHYKNGKQKTKNPRKIQYNPGQLRMDIEESEALKRFLRKRLSFTESSKQLYISHVATFCYFHQKKIDDLIKEYQEEKKNPPEDEDDLKVYNDMLDYIKHCIDNKQAKSTIVGKIKRMRTFFKDNKITYPRIGLDLSKYDDTEGYYTLRDLPDKKTMQLVINGSNFKHKALYAFAYTTGSGRAELANLKVKDFINGISEFCKSETPKEMIKELDGHTRDENKMVIPAIRMKRQKNNKPYYTVTTPECVQIIIDYIKTDWSILDDPEGRLFGLQAGAVGNAFKETNLKYGFGKRGRYNFFGCHRLRHNHYTQINNPSLACMLEGRKVKDKIDNIYNHNDDPESLKEDYKDHMHKFEIFDKYDLQINSEAMQKLQNENKELREKVVAYENTIKDLQQSNTKIETRIDSLETQLNKKTNEKTIEQLIDYASNHKLVKEFDLMDIVMELYRDKFKDTDIVYLNEQSMEELVYLAHNIKINRKTKEKTQEEYEMDPHFLDIVYPISEKLHKQAKELLNKMNYQLSQYQRSELNQIISEYAEKIYDEGKTVKNIEEYVTEQQLEDIITKIALGYK